MNTNKPKGKELPLISITGERKFEPQFEAKTSGAIILDGQEVAHTKMCVHGGEQFISIRGSGIRRGWCLRCRGVTCGKAACDPCIPFEAKLDYVEARNRKTADRLEKQFPNLKSLENL